MNEPKGNPFKKGGKTALLAALAAGLEAAYKSYFGDGALPDGVLTVVLTALGSALLNAWKHRNDEK